MLRNVKQDWMVKDMINEPIIIDGVDVSECKHFKIGTCLADYLLTDMNFSEVKCELCKDCYYKQLKHNEQECERLKHDNDYEVGTLEKTIDNLTAENEELKTTVAEIKDMCSEMNCESLMQHSWCGNTDFKMGCCEKLFKKQILQKIKNVSKRITDKNII